MSLRNDNKEGSMGDIVPFIAPMLILIFGSFFVVSRRYSEDKI